MESLPALMFYMPDPIYWYSQTEQKGYIIFTLWDGDGDGIRSLIKYDIETQKYHKTKSYDDLHLMPKAGGHAINTVTDQVYIFGGHGNDFAKYDLITDIWTEYSFKKCELPSNCSYPAWCMLPPPYNELHVYHPNMHCHFRLDDKTNKFETIYQFEHEPRQNITAPGQNSKLIFINNNLFLFAGAKQTRDIYRCKISDKTQKIKWKLCGLKLPERMSFRLGYKCIVAFENVVIIFKYAINGIYPWTRWYLDLGDIEDKELNEDNYEWIRDDIDEAAHIEFCVLTDNMVQFISPYVRYTNTDHRTVPLSSIIPKALCQKYNGTLIIGYVHKMENDLNLPHAIPQGIVKLILSYFV